MKIVYLGNNWLGYQVLKWLKEQGEEIVGLVIHPDHNQKCVGEIRQVVGLPSSRIFYGDELKKGETVNAIRRLKADIAISVLFDYIIGGKLLTIFPQGIINLHSSYLPYNRGQYPNVWSIVEETPAGVTLHYIDEGIDTGDIIVQREVFIEPTDTGESLYHKLERVALMLFQETWFLIRQGKETRQPQNNAIATYHKSKDVSKIDEIDLGGEYTARDLINVLRARTFPPYKGAYFRLTDGSRIYLRLQLLNEEELEK